MFDLTKKIITHIDDELNLVLNPADGKSANGVLKVYKFHGYRIDKRLYCDNSGRCWIKFVLLTPSNNGDFNKYFDKLSDAKQYVNTYFRRHYVKPTRTCT